MKTLSIKKLLTAAVVTLAALTITACNDSIRTENETAEAYLKINGSTARTVTFAYELGDMTDFVLTGKRTANSDIEHLAAFESYAALLQATIPIDQGAWHSLTLSAYEEQTAFTATVENVTIVSGMNSLTLTLAPDTAATIASTGTVRVTFNIPDSAKVSCVAAGLFDRSTDHAVSGYELEDISLSTKETGANAVYETDIASGTYRLKAFFYADEAHKAIVSTYNELVVVAAGNTSSAERTITTDNDIYTITAVLVLGEGGDYAAGYTPALTYTRYGVTLPEENDVEKDGYFLDGWYTDSDYTGERMTELTPAVHGDITLYAKWIQGRALYASELDSKNLTRPAYGVNAYMIRLLGEWTGEELRALSSKIKSLDVNVGYITLDMATRTTGITSLYDASTAEEGTFYNFSNKLTAVLLPDTLETISDYAFWYCTRLESVTMPASVTRIGNNAFSTCRALTSIAIPDSVTTIGDFAFSSCSALRIITIPASVTRIGSYAFNACSSLSIINFKGTVAQWKSMSRGFDWNNLVPATLVTCSDGYVTF